MATILHSYGPRRRANWSLGLIQNNRQKQTFRKEEKPQKPFIPLPKVQLHLCDFHRNNPQPYNTFRPCM